MKPVATPFTHFMREAHAMGELDGLSIAQTGVRLGEMWRSMTETEKDVSIYPIKQLNSFMLTSALHRNTARCTKKIVPGMRKNTGEYITKSRALVQPPLPWSSQPG